MKPKLIKFPHSAITSIQIVLDEFTTLSDYTKSIAFLKQQGA